MKRLLVALAAGAVLASAIYGAAASLGGISANTSLGADDAVVASCDANGVNLFMHTRADGPPGDKAYSVWQVDVGGIADACIGKQAQLFFDRADGTIYGNYLATVNPSGRENDNAMSFVIVPVVKVADIDGVHLQIG